MPAKGSAARGNKFRAPLNLFKNPMSGFCAAGCLYNKYGYKDFNTVGFQTPRYGLSRAVCRYCSDLTANTPCSFNASESCRKNVSYKHMD